MPFPSAYEQYFKKNAVPSPTAMANLRAKAVKDNRSIAINDPKVDHVWAQVNADQNKDPSVFDYYFSAQDVTITIAEMAGVDNMFHDLPLINFAFNVEQKKMPVYGFWDYTWSTMLRGVRLITGAFTIATRYPSYMLDLLSHAARSRANSHGFIQETITSTLTEDDANIDKYWNKNLDRSLAKSGINIFSVHPPFTFVVQYGIQAMSLESTEDYNKYYSNRALHSNNREIVDMNHRLVPLNSDADGGRLYIENVELTGVQQNFDSGGSLCAEVYSFVARDQTVPPVGRSTN